MRIRHVLAALAVAGGVLAAGAVPAFASNSPAIQLTVPSSTVNGTTAAVSYSINRGGDQVASLTCSLTGPTSSASCGTVSTPAVHATDGTVALSGLQTGTYTYSVSVLLTDGGTATASGSFTVEAMASPAITQLASGTCDQSNAVCPAPTTDAATLSGGDNPTGTIEFLLYPDANCSGTPVDDETVTVTGNGTYTTPSAYLPPFVAHGASYAWTATYSGDASNNPATTGCSKAGGVTINPLL